MCDALTKKNHARTATLNNDVRPLHNRTSPDVRVPRRRVCVCARAALHRIVPPRIPPCIARCSGRARTASMPEDHRPARATERPSLPPSPSESDEAPVGHSHTPGPIQCTAPMAAPCASKSTHSSPSSKPQIRTFPLPRPSAAWPPAQDRDGGQGGGDWRVGPPSFGRGSTPTTRGLAQGSRAPELNSKRVLGGPNAAVQKAHANCIAPNTPAAAPQSHGPYFFVEVRGPVASPHAGTPPPLAQARPRSQKPRQNSGSTPTPALRQARASP